MEETYMQKVHLLTEYFPSTLEKQLDNLPRLCSLPSLLLCLNEVLGTTFGHIPKVFHNNCGCVLKVYTRCDQSKFQYGCVTYGTPTLAKKLLATGNWGSRVTLSGMESLAGCSCSNRWPNIHVYYSSTKQIQCVRGERLWEGNVEALVGVSRKWGADIIKIHCMPVWDPQRIN